MSQEIIQVDAFTAERFRGNPAALCILDEPADERWMQSLAAEMNLSETAYLRLDGDAYALRWFTPVAEVDLCGHATVAAAHILWEDGHVETSAECRFNTKSGLLVARRRDDWIEVDFPREEFAEIAAPEGLAEALGTSACRVVENRLSYCLVEVESESIVRELRPDIPALKRLPYNGFVVTSRAQTEDLDFVSRFFAPRLGVDEDPVTGSAHCLLGPYWEGPLGKSAFMAYQASARGGYVKVTVHDDRVCLGGQAVTVMRGRLV